MLNFGGAQKSGEKKVDSFLKMDKCFRPAGIGDSEIIYKCLYPNRCVFSIKKEDSETGDERNTNIAIL
jgi:hypothetical protein